MSYQAPNFTQAQALTRVRIVGDFNDDYFLGEYVIGPFYAPHYQAGTRPLVVHRGLVVPLDDDEVIATRTMLGIVYDIANDKLRGGYYVVLAEKVDEAPPVCATGFLDQSEFIISDSSFWAYPNGSHVIAPNSAAMHLRDNYYALQVAGYSLQGIGTVRDNVRNFIQAAPYGRF